MSGRVGAGDFVQWADAVLAGTGWTTTNVRDAAQRGRSDVATVALADGFAAAAHSRGVVGAGLDGGS